MMDSAGTMSNVIVKALTLHVIFMPTDSQLTGAVISMIGLFGLLLTMTSIENLLL